MPKKMGVNSKAEAARARKSAAESDRKDRETREKEEQYWREAEGAKSRAAKKKEEEAEKRAEAAARKAEAKRLAELEEKELEKALKKPDKKANRVAVPLPKVTEAELRRRREEEQAAILRKAEEEKRKSSRTAAEEEYERMVLVENRNRDDSILEASTIEEAIAQMTVADSLPVDKHPEKRLKASFKAFEEAELPRLKEEKPGLTHTQYKDMIWKLWKKSPDNPLNQYLRDFFGTDVVVSAVNGSYIPTEVCPFAFLYEIWTTPGSGRKIMGGLVVTGWKYSWIDGLKSTYQPLASAQNNQRVGSKKRTIIIGLKSDNYSREILLRLLNVVVVPGDNVLAIHVNDGNSNFDANTFHIHEDLCKSKQVDFQVKVCIGSCYIAELSHQVRIHYATILAVGCSSPWPKDSKINKYLKALPPSCSLLVMDHGGRMLTQKWGTSQQGSPASRVVLRRLSAPFVSEFSSQRRSESGCHLQKSLTVPSSSGSSPTEQAANERKLLGVRKNMSIPQVTHKLFEKLATLEVKGYSRRFSQEELKLATKEFCLEMLIGEGGCSKVYRAILEDGQAAAVKVLNDSPNSEEDLLREVEILSSLNHENIIRLLGFCYCKDLRAVVYILLKESLRQKLKQLNWDERMQLAIGVAKALDYLHSFCPPIIHRDVKSSNILLCENNKPQLSDFGAATVLHQNHPASSPVITKPIHVVGTFGYLAPEYMMYGRVDEKIDVYSYGVVLLELITGKEAIQTKSSCLSGQESLVLWARSLLSSGLYERLIDPNLEEKYDKDEMKVMMIAARLCLLHSSSRRPTMKTVLRLLEEPENWLEMQRNREELLNGNNTATTISSSNGQIEINEDSLLNETLLGEDN
ncbi:OLC1v1003570C1 [Oldenlandia corymbosa var. corymbosa]|uniref:OLC1v1003570C1 n=1 Tax=Oldenlandia corymbosa var. corymbosa TaxID=529605 RepID=A0AAV1DDB5_OLDCO|nr:OLC1v1003570C1 [Oldenlandia corymbosa var. corymbosa]